MLYGEWNIRRPGCVCSTVRRDSFYNGWFWACKQHDREFCMRGYKANTFSQWIIESKAFVTMSNRKGMPVLKLYYKHGYPNFNILIYIHCWKCHARSLCSTNSVPRMSVLEWVWHFSSPFLFHASQYDSLYKFKQSEPELDFAHLQNQCINSQFQKFKSQILRPKRQTKINL